MKNRNRWNVVVTAAVLAVSLAAVPVSAGAETDGVFRTLDEIKESGTVNIGVFSDKNPAHELQAVGACRRIFKKRPEEVGKM